MLVEFLPHRRSIGTELKVEGMCHFLHVHNFTKNHPFYLIFVAY
jgi:hypothetical protein